MQCVLTIAGSDSGGGAGVQADLKTFAALGMHGTAAITAITAQNTLGVQAVHDLPDGAVTDQIRTILSDINIVYAKIGMLSSEKIVHVVAREIKGIPFVLDPVMSAEAGGALLTGDALGALVLELIPIATVVTPNVFEAEAITGIAIKSIEDAERAAATITDLGCKAAVVTGGHLNGTDVLSVARDADSDADTDTNSGSGTDQIRMTGDLIKGGTHGAGCTYSAALAAFLAKGFSIPDACAAAKDFVTAAIANSSRVGVGVAPVNQIAATLMNAARYRAIADVSDSVRMIEDCESFASLIPEVGCNIGTAISGARSVEDVAAVGSRIVRHKTRAKAVGCVEFGASSHIARLILAVMRFDPAIASALNVRCSEDIIAVCKECGYRVASFDRTDEPKLHETGTMDWGATRAIEDAGSVPQVIWDKGGVGKEAMVRILGRSAVEVAGYAIRVAECG
ncbi:MAG: Bifunctional thiamine biosynthesis protein ThiDN [Candidatus Methanogasteraceae archaeon]|nr:MAG: Bifunctional thiamine biosynthesis protein ThiDN [ANME-2 cluster archaeon]